jgi:hypothetical protein
MRKNILIDKYLFDPQLERGTPNHVHTKEEGRKIKKSARKVGRDREIMLSLQP